MAITSTLVKKLLTLVVSCSIYHAAITQNAVIDSLMPEVVSKKNFDETYIDKLNVLSFELLKVNPGLGVEYVNKSIQLSDSMQYTKGKYRALINKGSFFWISGLFDQALRYYYQALALDFESDREGAYILHNNIGEVFKKQGEYDSAFNYLWKSWNIAQKAEEIYPSLLASNIAELHLFLGQIDSARFYYTEAQHLAILDHDLRGSSYALFGLAEIEVRSNHIHSAINLHNESLNIREQIKDNRAIIQSLQKLSLYYLQYGEMHLHTRL